MYRQPAPIEGVQRLLQWQPRLVQPAMNTVAMSLLLLLLLLLLYELQQEALIDSRRAKSAFCW